MLRSFIQWNRKVSKAITPAHYSQGNVFETYVRCGGLLLADPKVSTVLDVGAGKRWHFPEDYKSMFGIHLIGIDIEAEEMVDNHLLNEAHEADVTRDLIVVDGSVDLITIWAGVEHFSDNAEFLRLAYAALRPGGRLIAQFPGSWAPFALINRILPERLKTKLLHSLVPGSEGILGFKAYYDNTRYSKFKRIAGKAGFDIDFHMPGFFASGYFAFFVPLYLLSLLLDLVRYGVGIRDTASYNLFILKKPGPASPLAWN